MRSVRGSISSVKKRADKAVQATVTARLPLSSIACFIARPRVYELPRDNRSC
ncbi:MAG: hypothetical protein HYZ72_10020 [Deltaproteobacteria bacterium]|nr:hypothetical protein [Deltaproteobacteria bacterium]